MGDQGNIDRLKRYCERNNIGTSGVLVITIQRNRTSDFSSLIVDFDNNKLLSHYPSNTLDNYKEVSVDNGVYLVCYKDNLQHLEQSQVPVSDNLTSADQPFCCNSLVLYRPRMTAHEPKFEALRSGKGNYPGYIFEVKRQVDNGPMISTKYFTVLNDHCNQVQGPFSHKLHTFKNYKCATHGLFFAVDLYMENTAYNYHHMRLNPFQHINQDLLDQFFAAANIQ